MNWIIVETLFIHYEFPKTKKNQINKQTKTKHKFPGTSQMNAIATPTLQSQINKIQNQLIGQSNVSNSSNLSNMNNIISVANANSSISTTTTSVTTSAVASSTQASQKQPKKKQSSKRKV